MHIQLYDISKTFHENVQLGPQFSGTITPRTTLPQSQWIDFLGYKLASPIGASACPVMMGKGIELLSQLGFDVLTYKTVRSTMYEGHPFPHVVFVDPASIASGTARVCDNQTGVLANSIGNVSLDPEWMMRDIAYARSCIRAGQVLIVSVYGHASAQRSLIEDFVHTARMVESAGAQVIELNMSCPNVRTGDVLYKDADMIRLIGSAVVAAVSVPVIFKCGTFSSCDEMANVMVAASRAGLRGIVGINTRPMRVVGVSGDPAFGRNREVAGVSGAPLYNDALQFVTWASDIIKDNKLDMIIVGAGGIVKADQFNGLLRAGARIALTATGMLCNPYIAAEYHENECD